MRTRTLSSVLLAGVAPRRARPSRRAAIAPTLPGDGTANVRRRRRTRSAGQGAGSVGRPHRPHRGAAGAGRRRSSTCRRSSASPCPTGSRSSRSTTPACPVVSMQLAIKAGREDEPFAHLGVSEFTADMLVKGTRRRKALDDRQGGRRGRRRAQRRLELRGDDRVVQGDVARPQGLPRPPARRHRAPDLPRGRDEAGPRADPAPASTAATTTPATLASLEVQNLLWGNDHVRGWVPSDASLDAITRDDLVAWHKAWYSPKNAILGGRRRRRRQEAQGRARAARSAAGGRPRCRPTRSTRSPSCRACGSAWSTCPSRPRPRSGSPSSASATTTRASSRAWSGTTPSAAARSARA